MNKLLIGAAAAALVSACSHNSESGVQRSNIYASGSSTVYPFTLAMADQFHAAHPQLAAPKIEENGTGPGIAKFCGGLGNESPDIVDASRRMRPEELAQCKSHGVTDIAELQIGLDGIAFVQSPGAPQKVSLTPKQIYEALAANPYGQPQKAKKWKDIDPSLPDIPILVYGPAAGHGTRDALVDLILEPACQSDKRVVAMVPDKAKLDQICTSIRTDGAYMTGPGDQAKTTLSMIVNPGAIGIIGYSFLEQNADKLRAIPIAGIEPSTKTIQSGKYPGSRPLFLYVKRESVPRIPGLNDFIATYAAAIGPGGALAKHGLIPADDGVLKQTQQMASSLPPSPKAAAKS
jgi:phosphate transport system substrate-binding protein